MKKKILFLVQLPPPVHGTSVMNKYAYESSLIRSHYDCSALPLQFASSVDDIGIFKIRKLWNMIVFCFRLMIKMREFKPDIVYFTIAPFGKAFYRDFLFCSIIKCFKSKLLLHLHGKGISKAISSSSLKKKFYRFVFRNSSVIVLDSSLQADIDQIFKGPVYVLHNGIEKIDYPERKSVPCLPSFLYLSNLVRSKGICLFLDSISYLHEKNIDFEAKIIGAPLDVTFEEISTFIDQRKLNDKVSLLGPLYGNEKNNILRKANILVLPTYYDNEAFPLCILEAMQAGLAVIAADNGAIANMIDDSITGYVIPMKNVKVTSEKMELLAKDLHLVTKMGRNAMEKFNQFFTIEKFEEGLLRIFENVSK